VTDREGGACGVLREIRSEAIEASLKEEAKLQEHFIMACIDISRSASDVGEDFISDNTDAATPLACLAYWKRRTENRLPGIIRPFEPVINDGGRPPSMSPTLFIPIPYLYARESREMLLINAHVGTWLKDFPVTRKKPPQSITRQTCFRSFTPSSISRRTAMD
jgi:hypothetical protein